MSFIEEIAYDKAEGEVKALYDGIKKDFYGRLPPVLSVLSLNPKVLDALRNWSKQISFGGSSLGRRKEEIIATYISRLNDCHY